MAIVITVDDLRPFIPNIDETKAEIMIADALAIARTIATCIDDPDFPYVDAVKAIIRGAIIRWEESGSGAVVQHTAGVFSETMDTRQGRRGMFWPTEISDLSNLCSTAGRAMAFTIDTTPVEGVA